MGRRGSRVTCHQEWIFHLCVAVSCRQDKCSGPHVGSPFVVAGCKSVRVKVKEKSTKANPNTQNKTKQNERKRALKIERIQPAYE